MKLDFEPGWIALGAVNNGKTPALAVANRDNGKESVRVFLANDRGGFGVTPSSQFSVSASPEGYKPVLRFVDLNKDGNLDLISANGRRNAMEIYLGDGRGGFAPGPIVQLESGKKVHTFDVGDLDGDGHLDLVTTSAAGTPDGKPGRLATRRGDGKGGFADAGAPILSVPPDPRVATLVDVNGDGRLDILLSHGRSNLLTVLLNEGKGTFTPRPGLPLAVGMSAYTVVAADLNGDKKADLVVATVNDRTPPFESKIVVLLGDGRGGFMPASGSPFPAAPGAYTLAAGDINEDGKLDLAASSFESDGVTLLLGQ
jgi:hypothetical protein